MQQMFVDINAQFHTLVKTKFGVVLYVTRNIGILVPAGI